MVLTERYIALALLFGLCGVAQGPSTTSTMIALKRHTVIESCREVTFELKAPPNGEWIFGVKTVNEPACFFWAGNLELQSHTHSKMLRHITIASDWPDSAIGVNGSVVSIDTQPGATRNLLIYATVPSGARVVVKNSGTVLSDSFPPDGFILFNGQATSDKVTDMSTLLRRIVNPSGGVNIGPSMAKLTDGSYVVNRANLKAHVTKSALPDVKNLSSSCNCTMRALFELYIDATGKVSQVKTHHGDPALLSAMPASLANWTFQPFTNDGGSSVPVRSPVSMIVDRNGTVHW